MKSIFMVLIQFIAGFFATPLLRAGAWFHAIVEDGEYMTLMNVMQATDASGSEVAVAEEAEKTRALFKVAPMTEANGQHTHMTAQEVKQSRIPRSRRANRGNEQYITSDQAHKEGISYFEDMIEVDEFLLKNNKNGDARRARENRRHTRDLIEGVATLLYYGNAADAENEIDGLATRFNDLALDNVTGAGGTTGNLASLFLVEFDQDFCSLIYPSGHKSGGVDFKDNNRYRTTDPNGKPYMCYGSQINMAVGLNVSTPASVQRLCNIEVNDPSGMGTNDMIDPVNMKKLTLMKKALPEAGAGKMTYIFCPREIEAQFEIWAEDHSSLCQKKTDLFLGTEVTHIKGIPVLMDDSLIINEGRVL